jgi:subtilase family protein
MTTSLIPLQFDSPTQAPAQIFGYLSMNSKGGTSLLGLKTVPRDSEPFHATKRDRTQALKTAEKSGLTLVAESPLGLAVVGPSTAYEELTGGNIATREVLLYAESGIRRYVTHIDIVGKNQPTALGCGRPRSESAGIEAVVLERPRAPQATMSWPTATLASDPQSGGIRPSPLPPSVPGFYLRVPQDVALGLGAPAVQRQGFRGQGTKVAMVDTGFYLHPFFPAHHYQIATPVSVVPGVDRAADPVGHGTGESANIFASAPDAQLQPIRASNDAGKLVAALAGFLKAKELKPHILTNSWGGDMQYPPDSNALPPQEAAFVLEIRDAIEQGIFVVFSAGNGQFSTEPQVEGVFAAGGTYMNSNMSLQASNYASGYASPFFPSRVVPDACGLVGQLPRAAYIMLPIPRNCELDEKLSQTDDQGNPGDGTAPNDGWALFSGTSAAAPQVAGAAAVLLSAKPNLTPSQIKEALTKTCVDVVQGRCHPRFNNLAGPGQDLATGFGLINIAAAAGYAQANF